MSAGLPSFDPVIDGVAGRKLPGNVNALLMGAMAVGLGALVFGFVVAGAAWTWGAVLVGIVYTMGMSQGGVLYAAMLTGTQGRWGRSIKRIGETFGFFLPVAYLLLLVYLLLGMGIYPWTEGTINPNPVDLAPHSPAAVASKAIWLSKPFFIVRHLVLFAILIALDYAYIKASLGPDIALAKARLGDKAPKWWDRFAASGTVDEQVEKGIKRQAFLGPVIGMFYAVYFSAVAFDLIMSLAPLWYTNMFGAWFFMSSFWLGMCTLGVVSLLSRDWLNLGPFLKTDVFHDLGKLILAFCMFWAYTTYAQILPIWYGNMPEEADFLLIRLYLPQWSWMSQSVAVLCFVMPFTTLLSRGIKKMRWPFAVLLSVIMFGIFMERSLLVMPSIYFDDTFPTVWFLVVNIGVWIGFLGLWGSVVGRALASVPPLVMSDPFLHPHPWDVHVHSLDHDAHAH